MDVIPAVTVSARRSLSLLSARTGSAHHAATPAPHAQEFTLR